MEMKLSTLLRQAADHGLTQIRDSYRNQQCDGFCALGAIVVEYFHPSREQLEQPYAFSKWFRQLPTDPSLTRIYHPLLQHRISLWDLIGMRNDSGWSYTEIADELEALGY